MFELSLRTFEFREDVGELGSNDGLSERVSATGVRGET